MVYRLVSYLLKPYVLLLLLMGLAIFHLWRTQREQRRRLRWLLVPYLILVVLSIPATAHFATGSLEWWHPPQPDRPSDVEAIVVLGGGVHNDDEDLSLAELDPNSVYRCSHAFRLYRKGSPCLVLATGGKDPKEPGPACADVMAAILVKRGVRPEDMLTDNTSRSTFENAVNSWKLLEKRQIKRIMVVTDARHLHRAVLCFRKQGFEVVPSGCHYRATEFKPSLDVFLPSLWGIGGWEEAAHEWLGLAWYWMTGKI